MRQSWILSTFYCSNFKISINNENRQIYIHFFKFKTTAGIKGVKSISLNFKEKHKWYLDSLRNVGGHSTILQTEIYNDMQFHQLKYDAYC